MRETWDMGIRHGIEIGLKHASVSGQIIELGNNTTDPKDQEFLEKFYSLCEHYNCDISYNQIIGMTVRKRDFCKKKNNVKS